MSDPHVFALPIFISFNFAFSHSSFSPYIAQIDRDRFRPVEKPTHMHVSFINFSLFCKVEVAWHSPVAQPSKKGYRNDDLLSVNPVSFTSPIHSSDRLRSIAQSLIMIALSAKLISVRLLYIPFDL